jgi:hypothetical protein
VPNPNLSNTLLFSPAIPFLSAPILGDKIPIRGILFPAEKCRTTGGKTAEVPVLRLRQAFWLFAVGDVLPVFS